MKKLLVPKFPKHVQDILDNKLKEIVRQLDSQGFKGPEIVYLIRRTKSRISQILNEKEK